jgi:hypothetical protein
MERRLHTHTAATTPTPTTAIRSNGRDERPPGVHSRLVWHDATGQYEHSGEHDGVDHVSVSPAASAATAV